MLCIHTHAVYLLFSNQLINNYYSRLSLSTGAAKWYLLNGSLNPVYLHIEFNDLIVQIYFREILTNNQLFNDSLN